MKKAVELMAASTDEDDSQIILEPIGSPAAVPTNG